MATTARATGIGLGVTAYPYHQARSRYPLFSVSVEASDVVVSSCKSRERRKRALIVIGWILDKTLRFKTSRSSSTKRGELFVGAYNEPPPIIAATVRLHPARSSPPLNISDNVANMLDGLLGSIPLWAHLLELALSHSLLLVLLCPRLES